MGYCTERRQPSFSKKKRKRKKKTFSFRIYNYENPIVFQSWQMKDNLFILTKYFEFYAGFNNTIDCGKYCSSSSAQL